MLQEVNHCAQQCSLCLRVAGASKSEPHSQACPCHAVDVGLCYGLRVLVRRLVRIAGLPQVPILQNIKNELAKEKSAEWPTDDR